MQKIIRLGVGILIVLESTLPLYATHNNGTEICKFWKMFSEILLYFVLEVMK